MPRYLGIDYGIRRIGLSISDAAGSIASPLAVVHPKGDLDAQAKAVIAAGVEYGVEAYVLGLPLNMDGTEGAQVKLTRSFGAALAARSGRPVHECDERLSSRGADEQLAAGELTARKRRARRDALAAQIILQSFLDAPGNNADK